MTTATYVSDSRVDVSWTRPSGSWAVRFERENAAGQVQVLNGVTYGTGSGVTTRVDSTVQADERYRYRVVYATPTGSYIDYDDGTPGAVVDDWSGYVFTTPAAPSNVTAARDALGDIVVSWQDNSAAETGFEVQDGTTTLVASDPASPYTHASPDNLVEHSYRVRAVTTGPRYSAWSAYATVGPHIAPAAPDYLTPNGAALDVGSALTLSWSHNPIDTTPQAEYELRHRPVGSPTWTTLTGTTAESRDISGTYMSATDVEWQVRTKGAHVDFSPWSALTTFTLAEAPTVNVTAPVAASTVTTSNVTVAWLYYQAASQAQTGWQVEILDGTNVVESASGADASEEWTTGTLANGASLTIRVRVRASSGLWSAWESVSFDVNYDPPNASTATASWQDGYGHVVLTATAVSGGGLPETVSHDFARSVDGGNTWTTFAEDIPLDATVLDWEAPAAGTYHYRITAVSALPSTTHTIVEVTVPAIPANCVLWLGGGPGFAQTVKLAANPVIAYDGGRERALHAFAGRSVPVEFSSMRASKTISVSATLMGDADPDSSTRADLEDLFDLPGPHCYRDPFGRVLYGTLSGLSWSREPGVGVGGVSFSITRSAPPDAAQAAALAGFYAPRIAEVAPGVYRFINADADMAEPGVYVEVE